MPSYHCLCGEGLCDGGPKYTLTWTSVKIQRRRKIFRNNTAQYNLKGTVYKILYSRTGRQKLNMWDLDIEWHTTILLAQTVAHHVK